MSLPGLFLREAKGQDSSLTQLPQDMDLWSEKIVSLLREKLPESRSCSIKISFTKRNEELGIAIGSAELYNQKLNKTIYIPLIIKNYQLCPLDVMMVASSTLDKGNFDVLPLTQDYFREILFNGDVFDKIDKPFDRLQQLYGFNQGRLTFPPTFRNTYASAQILDSIQDSIWNEDIKDVVDSLKSNSQILVGYEKRAHLDILRKIVRPQVKIAEKQDLSLKNITLIKKDMGGKYKTITTSDEAYGPIVNMQSIFDLRKSLQENGANADDTLHQVERNGEHLLFNDLSSDKGAAVQHAGKPSNDDRPVDLKTFGMVKVQDKNGVSHTGIGIPNVISYDMKQLPYKIFTNKQKSYVGSNLVGNFVEGRPVEFDFVMPQVGMTGTFVAQNSKNAIATFPVTVRSIYIGDGSANLVGMDLRGNKVKLKLLDWGCEPTLRSDRYDALELKKITKVKDAYLIPDVFKFLPLENFIDLADSKDSIMRKTAALKVDAMPLRIIHTGSSQFTLKGPDIEKMASQLGWNNNNLNATQTIFLMSGKRCPLTKTAEAIKAAGTYGESTVHGLPRIVWGHDVASEQIKIASQYFKIIRGLRVNLVKEAGQFEDSQLVDSALSLNFINPDNIDKFTSFIPVFEDSIKMLAQTLLASRLGLTEIPEQSTATAMNKMIDVIKGLKRVAMHTEENE